MIIDIEYYNIIYGRLFEGGTKMGDKNPKKMEKKPKKVEKKSQASAPEATPVKKPK